MSSQGPQQHRRGGAALTSENMGSFLAKSTTRVMAGVMILVNSLKASRSTLSPSDVGATGDWPILSGCVAEQKRATRENTKKNPKHPRRYRRGKGTGFNPVPELSARSKNWNLELFAACKKVSGLRTERFNRTGLLPNHGGFHGDAANIGTGAA